MHFPPVLLQCMTMALFIFFRVHTSPTKTVAISYSGNILIQPKLPLNFHYRHINQKWCTTLRCWNRMLISKLYPMHVEYFMLNWNHATWWDVRESIVLSFVHVTLKTGDRDCSYCLYFMILLIHSVMCYCDVPASFPVMLFMMILFNAIISWFWGR